MTKRLIRIGIVGTGLVAQRVHLPVLKNISGVEIAWIADRDAAGAARVASLFDVPQAEVSDLPACDIVLLATPLHARESYMKRFAERGTAVFAEKPFAVSSEQHAAYLDLFGVIPVDCAFMRRSYATMRALRLAVQNGWFGSLRSIRYREGGRVTGTEFSSATLDLSSRLGGGVLRDLGCHGVDIIQYVSGAADYSIDRCHIEWDGETDRHIEAGFVLSGGAIAGTCPVDFKVSWLFEQANTVELEFEHNALRAGLKPGASLQIASRMDFSDAVDFHLDVPGARSEYQSYFLEWDAVLEALSTKGASGFAASTCVFTTRLVEALYAHGARP